MERYKRSVFIFRRDLRLEDNTGLIQALRSSGSVIPCFIFDPRQVGKNPYGSDNAIQFMRRSLDELDQGIRKRGGRLNFFYGKAEDILDGLLEKAGAVFLNRDYTPFSRRRDERIEKNASKHGAGFHSFHDTLLNEPGKILKKDGGPYKVFTPYFRKASAEKVERPERNRYRNYGREALGEDREGLFRKVLSKENQDIAVKGGRREALGILKGLGRLKGCTAYRDHPARECTSMLSAHLKFGTVSVREVFHDAAERLGKRHPIIKELYWRDFFTSVSYHFPFVFKRAFSERFRGIRWSKGRRKFNEWCEGRTGVPFVDAGMRQLNATGFMPNRVRMVCASFLVKDLHIDWRDGERYFATKLVDYDPAVNNGNWQWVAGTGADAMPYYRSFNPWAQQKKYDPECMYIKRWVAELRDLSAGEIHSLNESKVEGYPAPIADHSEEARRSRGYYGR